jgi:hypothetical protein
MSRNGNGVYSLPAGNPVVTGTVITSTWANNTLNDIASALTASIAADGQTPMSGDLDLNTNKIVNLEPGTVAGNAVEYDQFVDATTTAVAITGGTIDGTPIGNTTRSSGKFTTLAANGATTLTSTLDVTGATNLLSTLDVTGFASFDSNGEFNGTGALKLPAGTTGQQPTPAIGMVRYNSTLGQFEGYGTSWGSLGGGATGGGSDQVFVLNDQVVTTDYTIPVGKNASSAGGITIDTGVTVTISTGSNWVIV